MDLFTLGLLQKNLSGNKGDIKSKNGESSYTITDAVDFPVLGLNLYGKSTQDGTPTPDAPVDIVSVGDSGSVAVTACGKNLYQGTKVSPKSSGGWYCILGGVDVTTLAIEDYKIPYGEKLTLSLKYEGDLYTSIKYKKDGNFTNLAFEDRSKQIIFTIPEDYDELFIFSRNGTSNSFEINDIQIELGDTATSYEPYKSTTATITSALPLCGIPVESGGNYTDSNGQQWICDYVDFEKGVKVQRIIGGRMYGTTNGWKWYLRDNRAEYYATEHPYISLFKNVLDTKAISNAFLSGAHWNDNSKNKIGVSNASKAYVFVGASTFASLSELTSYLDSNEVYVYSELATPIETPFSATEMTALRQLMTYSGTTNISNSDNADMDVKYCINQTMADYYPIFAGQGADVQPLVLFQGTDKGYSLADGFTGFSAYYTDTPAWANIEITQLIDSSTESQYGYKIAKSFSANSATGNYTDSAVISSNEEIDLTPYSMLLIDFYGFCNYDTSYVSDAEKMAAYFKIDRPDILPQSKIAYDWTGWDNMGMSYHRNGKYYFDVSQISGKHYLSFGIYHGDYNEGKTNGIKIYKMTLI